MANRPLRLIVCGASGRMGARVAALAAADPRFTLSACLLHKTLARFPIANPVVPAELPLHLRDADALVDFSTPAASLLFAKHAAAAGKTIVIGTTGFSPAELARLKSFAKKIPLFLSPNFSPGVNLLFHLGAQAAKILKNYDASVSEIHHRQKKDSPSGTALRLAQRVMEARKDRKAVPAVSQRLGDVIGEHTLTLAGACERLELTHKAHSRDVFAEGALEAALWVSKKKPGLYDMPDMLKLS